MQIKVKDIPNWPEKISLSDFTEEDYSDYELVLVEKFIKIANEQLELCQKALSTANILEIKGGSSD